MPLQPVSVRLYIGPSATAILSLYIYIYITIGGAEPNLTYATPIRTRAERGRTGRGRGSTSYILVYTALRR